MLSSEFLGLIPHLPPMLLVDKLISINGSSAVIEATIKDDYPFTTEGVGVWIGLELIAQSAAVLSKLRDSKESTRPSLGFLLGSRSFIAHKPVFTPGQRILIEIDLDPESIGLPTINASGVITDALGDPICEGALTLFEPNDDALYLTK